MKRLLVSVVLLGAGVLVLPAVSHHAAVPMVDYTTAATGTVPPNDAEYLQYRDEVPDSDPLGPVIPAPPDGSPVQRWRAFGVAQCERLRHEPPWYRRGAGCHVTDDPVTPHMAFDLPPTERADLDRDQQDRINRVCGAANKLGYECNVIATDGP